MHHQRKIDVFAMKLLAFVSLILFLSSFAQAHDFFLIIGGPNSHSSQKSPETQELIDYRKAIEKSIHQTSPFSTVYALSFESLEDLHKAIPSLTRDDKLKGIFLFGDQAKAKYQVVRHYVSESGPARIYSGFELAGFLFYAIRDIPLEKHIFVYLGGSYKGSSRNNSNLQTDFAKSFGDLVDASGSEVPDQIDVIAHEYASGKLTFRPASFMVTSRIKNAAVPLVEKLRPNQSYGREWLGTAWYYLSVVLAGGATGAFARASILSGHFMQASMECVAFGCFWTVTSQLRVLPQQIVNRVANRRGKVLTTREILSESLRQPLEESRFEEATCAEQMELTSKN